MTYRNSILPRAREAFGRWQIQHCAPLYTFVNLYRYGDGVNSSTFTSLNEAAEDAVDLGNDYLGTIVWNGDTFMADLTEHGEILAAEAKQEADDSRRHEAGVMSWYRQSVL